AKPVTIHHDYSGIAAWAAGDWKTNNEFTQAYARFIRPFLSWVSFNKVPGHAGVEGNELADRLAREAMDKEEAR
ncbi:MAG TPA: RNase H family protein, partial [Negativicutes bacterium]|nr:RNase H family protein [Negativicutes bacterium]